MSITVKFDKDNFDEIEEMCDTPKLIIKGCNLVQTVGLFGEVVVPTVDTMKNINGIFTISVHEGNGHNSGIYFRFDKDILTVTVECECISTQSITISIDENKDEIQKFLDLVIKNTENKQYTMK